ncbi:MAG: galactokinase [Acidobacteriaceae bacterium]|nr:galactokinase [Acidobacteriaceae bacterium]
MALIPGEIVSGFRERFRTDATPVVYRAPGRVNLIGEHTDYNLGFVFPIALKMACYVAIAPAEHKQLRMYSRDFDDESSIEVDHIPTAKANQHWSDYVVGVAHELRKLGVNITGADLWIASEVPTGSGLSSSAALEVSTAIALLGSQSIDKLELARLCQRAESQFVGMPCGIMDQYASVFGREHAAIQIDCRSLEHEYVPLPEKLSIIAVNSLVKHELGTSAYRDRVAECQEAVSAIQKLAPSVESLRDVSLHFFERIQDSIPPVPRRRARHVISDSQRVLDLAAAARASDLREMGRLFVASHRSMQYDYEISCEEIDFLVDTAIKLPGVYGSRMTGGGFGGCTVNLVAPEAVDQFQSRLSAAYSERYSLTPVFYDCIPAGGAGRVMAAASSAD